MWQADVIGDAWVWHKAHGRGAAATLSSPPGSVSERNRMPSRLLPLLFACGALAAVPRAQATAGGERDALAAQAIRQWVDDYERGRLGAHGPVRAGGRLQPRYCDDARRAGFLDERDVERLTHLDVLQKLLFHAEKNPSGALADAGLGVAAVGLESSFLDRDALELRELGHWTLMRMEHQGAWFVILRAAAGERVPLLDELRPADDGDEAITVGPARRVAALRLIGQRGLPVFRSTLEAALVDADPRVRLAATESMLGPWRADGVRRVAAALERERHPVVSQALVRLLLQMLEAPPDGLDADARRATVTAALAQFGTSGWRTDMDLLDLVEAFPDKAAIPTLIRALDLEQRSPDALVSAVNKRASPMLRDRAGGLLRAMTGALVPIDDPAAWRTFWQREQDHIVVPPRLNRPDPEGTRVTFFGVPVTGGSIGFLIDTSGSMDDEPAGGPQTGPRRRRSHTRLDAAKEQLVLAAQAMPKESQYFVLTFADRAHVWTTQPIRPQRQSLRSLTELLSRLRAHGGTNLYDGLVTALELEGKGYGDASLPKIDELFVLSDGEPTTGPVQQPETLLEMVKQANRYAKVRIHTVFTGTGGGADLLRKLAEQNGGVFVQR